MKLEGRTAILIELDQNEYSALSKQSDDLRLSMTMIVRGLIKENLMKEEIIGSLSKRIVKTAEEVQNKPIVVHLADDEYEFLKKQSDRSGDSMTLIVRNLIRKHVMGVGAAKEEK